MKNKTPFRIAYVIASYAQCKGRLTAIYDPPDTSTYISIQLDKLRKVDHSNIDTIIIMKAATKQLDANFYDYSSENLPPIIEVDCPNNAQSYGQWIQCFHAFPDFDYYLLIEDDYCLDNPNAVSLLLQKHKEKLPGGGYLCSRIFHNPTHAAISNGLIDRSSIDKAIQEHGDLLNFISTAPVKEFNNQAVYQINFAVLFGSKLAHIADEYSVPYWVNEFIEHGEPTKSRIFIPIQGTVTSMEGMRRRI